nr:MAG TPA: hypothetical protein [Caudoviricetes sp.]
MLRQNMHHIIEAATAYLCPVIETRCQQPAACLATLHPCQTHGRISLRLFRLVLFLFRLVLSGHH